MNLHPLYSPPPSPTPSSSSPSPTLPLSPSQSPPKSKTPKTKRANKYKFTKRTNPLLMVFDNTMGWLSEVGSRVGDNLKRSLTAESKRSSSATQYLGILSFETAKTMSRLVSLYKSLDDIELVKLKKEVTKSKGVAFLNSKDEVFLLSLACAEKIEDLDKAATTVARLGHKCSDFGLNRFDLVYTDLKLGIIDLGKLEYASKDTEKRIDKMEKLVSATSRLYTALEALSELEVSERKLKQWKLNSRVLQSNPTNFDLFNKKISYQRKQVRHFREISLWNQTFDKSVGLMARIVCIVYARICLVFGPYLSFLPCVSLRNIKSSQQKDIIRFQPEYCLIEPIKDQVQITSRSGPIPTTSKRSLIRFHSQKSLLFLKEDSCLGSTNRVFHAAGPSTVGGSGLTMRYANVILLAERYLDSAVTIGDDAREDLYMMLPENLRMLVKSKLAKNARAVGARATVVGDDDVSLAEGWREALKELMGWLLPMAKDTVKWQAERNFEKMKFDSKPSVLLLQTFHFSDKEKAEAAIAEVLVGMSCIYWYENRRNCDDAGSGGGSDVVGYRSPVLGARCSFDGIGWSLA
ncbi:unnamed protein product [Camellia sinensis]